MTPPEGRGIRWYRRLGLRVGVLVALVVLTVDLVDFFTWQAYAEWLHPDWFEPAALREAADELERTGELEWLSDEDRRSYVIGSVLFAALLATIAAFLVSRMATRRLRRLADQARAPAGPAALPGPFEASGRDEITVLADALNSMRNRVGNLVQDLAGRDSARRRWIAQVSHDLRTPMTALSISLDRTGELYEKADPSDRAEIAELLAAARVDVRRVGAFTEDLLEIARLEAGHELVHEPVPAGELVLQTVEALLPVANDKGVALEADVPRGLPTLQADGRRLARALENLVMNALQHARSVVRVAAREEGSALLFTVEDDGRGFPESPGELRLEDLESLRSRSDSSGLGLRVAREVAEAHGGALGARNLPAGGAAVWLRVPAV